MTLTAEQIQALKDGEPVTVADTEIGLQYVMLRSDVFEQVQQ